MELSHTSGMGRPIHIREWAKENKMMTLNELREKLQKIHERLAILGDSL